MENQSRGERVAVASRVVRLGYDDSATGTDPTGEHDFEIIAVRAALPGDWRHSTGTVDVRSPTAGLDEYSRAHLSPQQAREVARNLIAMADAADGKR